MAGTSVTPALRVASAKASDGGRLDIDVGRATEHHNLHLQDGHEAAL